jgi:hypothetical protein
MAQKTPIRFYAFISRGVSPDFPRHMANPLSPGTHPDFDHDLCVDPCRKGIEQQCVTIEAGLPVDPAIWPQKGVMTGHRALP